MTEELIGGRYALGEPLTKLGVGMLLKAQDRHTGHSVQVHRAEPDSEGVSQSRVQARTVSQRMAALRHRNLPRVIDLVDEGDFIYSVQEEFRGQPLDLLTLPLEPELVRRYLDQLLSALSYLHGSDPRIIHRDVRPETVLVAPHGTLLLTGLDLARTDERPGRTVFRGQGSAHFASPEQLMGEPSDPAQDLYSAGAVAYFLATGSPPPAALKRFQGHMRDAAAAGALSESDHQLPFPTGFPSDLAQRILQLLHVDPDRRTTESLVTRVVPKLPEFLLTPPAEAMEPSATTEAAPEPPVKRSMWQLLLGRDKPTRPHAVPDEEGPEAKAARDAYPFFDLLETDMELKVAQLLPETAARSMGGICVGLAAANEIIVVARDPSLVYIHDFVNYATQGRYRATLRRGDPATIDRALEWAYRSRSQASWRTWMERRALDEMELVVANPMADVSTLGEEISHPIVQATERVIKEALAVGASDIHIEAFELRIEVRYRIDGVLQPAATYSNEQGSAMVKRIKVMANMDIAQERITQGGRISLALGDKKYDLRVSIVPVAYGESVVMRVLKKGSFNLTLSDLGIDDAIERRFRAALSQPHGIILVCGPTGSGKSTTLYASLKELQRPDRKLLTVEDPVEYGMDGLVQVQVNTAPRDEDQQVTFAKVLREFLRQDPEVILVGEIRDPETASIALQASLTGHLVLSTLHTNDSIGLISRLRDMNIKAYLVASTLRCGLSQRLARRICPKCKEEIKVQPEVRDLMIREGLSEPYRQFRGKGCRECLQTGYRGRVGIYELMEVSPTLRSLIAREASDDDLLAQLKREGFRSLYQNALEKVIEGSVSFEEVQRVCESG